MLWCYNRPLEDADDDNDNSESVEETEDGRCEDGTTVEPLNSDSLKCGLRDYPDKLNRSRAHAHIKLYISAP